MESLAGISSGTASDTARPYPWRPTNWRGFLTNLTRLDDAFVREVGSQKRIPVERERRRGQVHQVQRKTHGQPDKRVKYDRKQDLQLEQRA